MMTLDKSGGGHGGGRNHGFNGGSHRAPSITRGHSRGSSSTLMRRAPRVGSLRGTGQSRRGSTRGYGRNYRHVGYRRGFWGRRGGGFYPFGFGAYWFGLYPWLPYYYGLYAYNYYPALWTPIYVPNPSIGYDTDPRLIVNDSSYMLNPDLPSNTEVPTQPLPSLGIDTNVLRSIGNKKREDLTPDEETRVKQVFDGINVQHTQLINRLRQDGSYSYWTSRGYRIVPDIDRNRFIWIRDDSVSDVNRIGSASEILLNHYHKDLDGHSLLYEEGYLMTKSGNVYEYSVENDESSLHHPTLEEKMRCAMWIGSLVESAHLLNDVHEKLESQLDIHYQNGDKSTGCEFLIGYHVNNSLPRIIYGAHNDVSYHCESDIIDLYNSLTWHEMDNV